MVWNLLVFVLFIASSSYVECFTLPDLKLCPRSGNARESCHLALSEAIVPILKKGIPEWNVASMDPLDLGPYHYDQMRLTADTHSRVIGYSDLKIMNSTINWDTKIMNVKYLVPSLIILSEFKVDGEMFDEPIWGKGQSSVNITNFVSDVNLKFLNAEDENGVEHMTLILTDLKYNVPDSAHFDCTELYDGDNVKRDNVIAMANGRWKEIITDYMQPAFKLFLTKLIIIANSFLANVSTSALFEDI